MNLKEIKGIGDKTAILFEKLNIYSPDDLIHHFPINYSIYEEPVPISKIDNRLTVSVKATVVKAGSIKVVKNLKILTATLKDIEGTLFQATWFNAPYLRNSLHIGDVYIFRGKVSKGKMCTLEHPEIFTDETYSKKMHEMQPVYKKTEGLTNNAIIKYMHTVLDDCDNPKYNLSVKDIVPSSYIEKNRFVSYSQALKMIHFPKNYDELYEARRRLAYEEFLMFIIALKRFKEHDDYIENNYIITESEKTKNFIENLPFTLTDSQLKVYNEIMSDMSGKKMMNRLIQGDVGCGKTIVAVLALLNTALSGYQGALMAPTEVLARQHYLSISKMIDDNNLGLCIVLLTGSMSAKQKKDAKALIESCKADIVIGTHALIQDNVTYNNLALVITDEQHRFGVKQREVFSCKGSYPHILVMSATPIPRTLAIILYGDLDISIIDTLPADRLPVKNCVMDTSFREKAYNFIEKEVKAGHQAYVICPMVDESDMIESEDVISYSKLLKDRFGDNISVEYLHGKMKASDKNAIMERFSEGKIDVLVSTTVIEVGVNVPNATVMLVENAERFGLAGLHQIRGRVGRGNAQSYCMFICTTKNPDSLNKLKILERSNDGFYIASEDLKLRGPGDLFGIRQSGDFEFKIGDIFNDSETLKLASDDAKNIETDVDKEEYGLIYEKASEIAMMYLNKINL
ncbi:MAG: ATP-dependent DNA helicase RecG [Lachnospiraceae bacterium]|nr:ATP-dependent DNA helicase RecG [Lachnospiraceae bacterium]